MMKCYSIINIIVKKSCFSNSYIILIVQKYGSFSNIQNPIRVQIFCSSDICGCWFGNHRLAAKSERSHVHEESYQNGSDGRKQHAHSVSISYHLSQLDAFFRYHMIHIHTKDKAYFHGFQ